MSQVPGLFITGNHTNIGKTYVTALIAKTLAAQGLKVGVYKPVASGCEILSGQIVADDALKLWQAADAPEDLEHVCPQRFRAPLAPYLAARAEGREIDRGLIQSGLEYWQRRSDIVLVEGAGGLMSPVTEDEYVADLAEEFGYPLIVVAQNALGVIHQTLQTLIVAEVFRSGLPLAGIVLNDAAPDPQDLSTSSNRSELQLRTQVPVLAQVAFQGDFDADVPWMQLACGH